MNPLPPKIRRQRRRLILVAITAGFFALVMLSLLCGSVTADWLG